MFNYVEDFPFDEIKNKDGDYFHTPQEAMNDGHSVSQVWSVTEDGEEDTLTYGPHMHYVNKIGYIATKEHHDFHTYYEVNIGVD